MFRSRKFQKNRIGPKLVVAVLTLTAITICVTPAQAVITDTDWSLKLSEREMAFRPATDAMAMKTLMWDLPYSRQAARNMPFICLSNESAVANITQFKMTIGDEQFHFANSLMGMFAKLGRDTKDISLSSTVENGGNTLVVDFLNGGLAPGKTANFQFDIDVDAQFAGSFFPHPDYRTVLFDMNGDNIYINAAPVHQVSSTDNAKVSLKFEMPGMPSVSVGPVPFDDPTVGDGSAVYVNSRVARYGDTDPVRAFSLSGGTAIPEPGCMVLATLGLAGLTLPLARRGRNAQRISLAA